MKNIFKILTIFLLIPLAFHACREAYNDDWTTPDPSLKLHDTGITSSELFPSMDTNLFKLTWDNTLNVTGDYNVVMSKTSDFKTKAVLATTQNPYYNTNIASLNAALLAAGYSPFTTEKVFMRIEFRDAVSNTISFDIKPYPVAIPVLTLPTATTDLVLNDKTPDAVATKVTWTDSPYGVEVEYLVEVAKKGETTFVAAGSVKNAKTLDWTHKALNDVALKAGLAPAVKAELDVRVIAVTKTTGGEIRKPSKVVTFKVTPYVAFKNLYLVGDATAAGWNTNNNNQALYRDASNTNKFYFTGKFGTSMFKLLEILGDNTWQPQWGLKGGVVANSDGGEPEPFTVSTAGYYTFEVDILAKTYSITPYSGAMTTYSSIDIAGNLNGWSGSTVLTQSSFDPHQWFIKDLVVSSNGEAKFRANGTWDINWGAAAEFSGQGTQGGANIPLNAGTYDVYFNDIDGRYVFVKK